MQNQVHPFTNVMTHYPKHMYSASGNSVTDPTTGRVIPASTVAYNASDESHLKSIGYSEKYVEQEYPKWLGGRLIHNAQEERLALADAEKEGK
jgi:hypothetical protein